MLDGGLPTTYVDDMSLRPSPMLRLGLATLIGLAMAWALLAGLALLLEMATTGGDADKRGAVQRPKPKTTAANGRLQLLAPRSRPAQPAPRPEESPPEEALNGQIVETARPETEQVPQQAKYLGRYDMRVDRETKASGRRSKGGDLGRFAIDNPSPLQSPQSDSRDPTQMAQPAQPAKGERTEQAQAATTPTGPGAGATAPSTAGPTQSGSVVVQGAPNGLLLPSTSPGNVLRNLQALSGSAGSNDYLPDVEDEGETNLLNTRKFRYWDYFQRIKEQVSREWEPGQVWRSHDPNGQRYGVKNRLTVLRVTLDPEGALKHLRVAKQSGLEFLDDEARRAFSAASPFPNPPSGLRNGQGEIEFQFGFLFEISTQRFRMRGWQ